MTNSSSATPFQVMRAADALASAAAMPVPPAVPQQLAEQH